MKSHKSKIGITGSTGVLGQALLACLADEEVVTFEGDISEEEDVFRWYEENKPFDAIFHMAAIVPVQTVQEDPLRAFRVNVGGTCNLLEAIRVGTKEHLPWIFYCSSSHVYATSSESLTEDSKIEPVTIYGSTKAQGERWCEIYQKTYGLPICIGRVFSFSSPKQPKSYFIPSMISRIQNASQEEVLEVRGLLGTRDFLTPEQIAPALLFLLKEKAQGVFNIGTGEGIRLLDLTMKLRDKLERQDISIKAIDSDTNHLVANVQRLKNLGFSLSFNADAFLESVLKK